MTSSKWKVSLLMACIVSTGSLAFHHPDPRCQMRNLSRHCGFSRRRRINITTANIAAEADAIVPKRDGKNPSGACYYRRIDGSWKPRKELNKLFIGERLFATRLPERDLLEGKTGPKAFLECGVGKRNSNGKWSKVNCMIRLGKGGMKTSLARKKALKLPPGMMIEVYVSRIKMDEGALEVCLNRDEALEKGSMRSKIPASSLKLGDVLTGIVKNVTPYGVFVDVNANRNGLLHISKVAKQQDAYVSKEDGLKKLGLDMGSTVNVVVMSNDRKRLELDLAPALVSKYGLRVEDSGDYDAHLDTPLSNTRNELTNEDAAASGAFEVDRSVIVESNSIGDDEAAMWAAYALDSSISDADDDDGDEYEEYDEDSDIEDSLGIGYY